MPWGTPIARRIPRPTLLAVTTLAESSQSGTLDMWINTKQVGKLYTAIDNVFCPDVILKLSCLVVLYVFRLYLMSMHIQCSMYTTFVCTFISVNVCVYILHICP